jgi:hypothetical protein
METLRLSGFAFGFFLLAFAAISWATRGTAPVATAAAPARPEPVAAATPVQPEVTAAVAEPAAAPAYSPIRDNVRTLPEDNDRRRQTLRHAALRAANDFEIAPCDPATKRALVTALTNYAKAWTEMAGCKSANCGADYRLDKAGGAFSTATDMRVRFALRAAFDKGGVGRDDFPPSLRLPVTMLVGDPGDTLSVCTIARRADATR